MKTIVVSGAHSGIGKTLFAQELLRRLKNWSALKVTVKDSSGCPRNQKDCNICAGLQKDFEIIKDKKIINQKGTDTARLRQAGTKKVIWLRSTFKGLKAGLKKALFQLRDAQGILIEGTSVLRYIKPNVTIFLKDNNRPLRAAARRAQKKADIIIDVDR